ncbi:biotin/lipoyl-binding protein [Hydrogenophaga sp. 5NK40-0174]|uniref:efflux RND transporter periplasmic adaptor subunit n=1 Tax=Hydrogenophaga sp. 5NK40-0174 TaxID=3127649 RepID=UPI0031066923
MSDTPDLGVLLQIEARAMAATGLPSLRFTIVNETHALASYRQAALFEQQMGRLSLQAASGLVSVANDSPFAVWLTRFAQRLPRDGNVHCLDFENAAPDDKDGWEEWLPDHLLVVPVKSADGKELAIALYARETPWSEQEVQLLGRLHLTYANCYLALKNRRPSVWARLGNWFGRGRAKWWLLLLLGAMFVPVRLSVLAPAEVIALNALAVAAPQDGVIGAFAVAPNGRVATGDLLFSLDDTVLTNKRQVAQKALEVARADAHIAQQRAFDDVQSKAEVAVALGKVREKEAELAAVEEQAKRVEVRADRDGVAIFSDPNDWIGRPVQTGERVMQLAQPEDAGMLIWLGTSDAIELEEDAPVRMFLHTDPLGPRDARVFESSYQSSLSQDGVASYRLRARFNDGEPLPRIGLRGTARLSGEWVFLGYYLFRRPLATVREWTGL